MHLIDDIHLEAAAGRRVQRAFEQFTHVVNLGVGRGVQFNQVDKTSTIDFLAGTALPAGRRGDSCRAVQRLGKDARDGGLADPARAGKQVSMMQSILVKRVAERLDDMLLPRQLRESFWTPFARENRSG